MQYIKISGVSHLGSTRSLTEVIFTVGRSTAEQTYGTSRSFGTDRTQGVPKSQCKSAR